MPTRLIYQPCVLFCEVFVADIMDGERAWRERESPAIHFHAGLFYMWRPYNILVKTLKEQYGINRR